MALDAARAEFRAAWRAKVARLRGVAGIFSRLAGWMGRMVLLSYLVFICLAVARFLPNSHVEKNLVDVLFDTVFRLFFVQGLVRLAGGYFHRRADRLETGGVQNP